ncbi:hypothetical protein NYA30BAC_01972 [Halomonas sp. NYA30]
MSVFLKLLRWVPGWAWVVALVFVLAFSLLGFIQGVVSERDQAVSELETSRLETRALESALEWRRTQAAKQLQALELREAELQRVRAGHQQQLDALNQLEQNDEETADWTGVALPNAIRDWVRQLPGEGGRSDRDDAGGAGVSTFTDSSTDASN